MQRRRTAMRALPLLLLPLVGAGCASDPPRAEPTGYLEDYSGFRPHPERPGALLYTKPDLDLARYKQVMVDPAEIALSPEAAGRRVKPEDLARLARYMSDAMTIALRRVYPIVEQPGLDVLRLRIAITEVIPTRPVLTTAENLLLPARAASIIRGTNLFVGQVAIEAEAVDSVSGDRLVALVDRKMGDRSLKRGATTWGHVEKAFREWAVGFRLALDQAHRDAATPPAATGTGAEPAETP
jgi:hypothetical protein